MSSSKGPGKSAANAGAAEPPGRGWPDPRRRVAADRMLQLEICTALEGLADSLPNEIDLRLGQSLVCVLEPSWTEHVSFQHDALFPILMRRHDGSKHVLDDLERCRREHEEISDRHNEVNEQIELLIGGEAPNPEMLGYLLRGAFESRRRHIDGEQTLLDRVLPSLFTPADRAAIDAWNATRPQPPFPINLLLGIRN
jgi:hypothetical protein